MKTRDRKNPRRRLNAWVKAGTADEMDAEALRSGLSIGQLVDRLWLASHVEVRVALDDAGVIRHVWFVDSAAQTRCRACGVTANDPGRSEACPAVPKS